MLALRNSGSTWPKADDPLRGPDLDNRTLVPRLALEKKSIQGREKVYWVHLVWVAVILFRAIFWWWFEFRLSGTEQWSFMLYIFVLLYAILI